MRKIILAAVFAAISTPAFAKCDMYGNCYTVREKYDGSVAVQGFNSNGTWSQEYKPDGRYSGYDIDGNFYQGNNKTGQHLNYGTGETCFGKGAGRVCY